MTNETFAKASFPAETRAPLVSVIIPHYNDLDNLKRCIDLLAAQTVPRSQFEIVVADNNSSCGLNEVAGVCGAFARVVRAPIQGAGPARNAAIATSCGDILAFTDSDCRPAPDWLERGLAALSNIDADLVGGRVDVDARDPARPTAVEAFELVFAFNVKRYIERLGFSTAANMFVPREIFDRVGPFRVQLPLAIRGQCRCHSSRPTHVGGALAEVAAAFGGRFRVGARASARKGDLVIA